MAKIGDYSGPESHDIQVHIQHGGVLYQDLPKRFEAPHRYPDRDPKNFRVLMNMTKPVVSSCLDNVDDNPASRNPEKEMRELNEALSSIITEGYDIDTTQMGIYYIVHEEGEGPLAQEGDTLSLQYTGYLLSGQIFDASSYHYADSTWEFVLIVSGLIPGFVDGLSVMNKGAAIDMIIPSQYAYGATGNGPIEPYTTILFSTMLHNLTSGSLQKRNCKPTISKPGTGCKKHFEPKVFLRTLSLELSQ